MNDIMIFEGNAVEVFELNNEVLFNPYHVGKCLDIADVKSSTRDFNKNQIVKVTNSDVHTMHFRKLNNAGENFLTESGVYKLIFKSRKPEAEKFQDWVTDEVLPSIRKTGEYKINTPKIEKAPSRSKIASDFRANIQIAKLCGLEGNQAILSGNKMTCSQYKNFGVNPLLESGVDLISETKTQYFTPTQLGKQINITAKKVNQSLEQAGLQVSTRDGRNRLAWIVTDKGKPFCQMIDVNKKHSDGSPVLQIKWTQDVLEHCPEN